MPRLRLIAGGDVAPVDFNAIPNYADVFEGLKNQSYNTVERRRLRRPARPRRQRADVRPDRRDDRAATAGPVFAADSPYKGKVTAYNYADLHRRRGAVPDEDQARPQHHEPVRARQGPARRGGRPAQDRRSADRQVLGHRPGGDRRLRQRRHGHRHGLAVPGQHRSTPPAARRSRWSSPRRARPAGRTPG